MADVSRIGYRRSPVLREADVGVESHEAGGPRTMFTFMARRASIHLVALATPNGFLVRRPDATEDNLCHRAIGRLEKVGVAGRGFEPFQSA